MANQPSPEELSQITEHLTKGLMDRGQLVEVGWMSYLTQVMSPHAGPTQIEETKQAFYAGAQHVFASIITSLDSESEPTEQDIRRIDLINEELQAWGKEFLEKLRAIRAQRG